MLALILMILAGICFFVAATRRGGKIAWTDIGLALLTAGLIFALAVNGAHVDVD